VFDDVCPKTTENFLALCTGEKGVSASGTTLCYRNTPVHRVQAGGWVQAGDIVTGRGDSGESIFGATFPDEGFTVKHDGAGILSMANHGPHSNSSQFLVTLDALPWLDGRQVAFGRVVTGMRIFRVIAKAPLKNGRPVDPVLIVSCGKYKAKPVARPQPKAAATESKEAEEPAPVRRAAGTVPCVDDVLGVDLRGDDVKRTHMDLRRPSTKKRLLQEVFSEIDTSGDHEVSYGELMACIKKETSLLRKHFPKHVTELTKVFDAFDRDADGKLSWTEFLAAANAALNVSGGR
jgi:cyclophilin family peptidyl-prolyl cis-trans isomerase